MTAIPLCHLKPGQAARISRVHGRADHVHRLEEFGLRTGVVVRMFRPGNPCILHLDGNKICLRADDYLEVFVEPIAAASIVAATPCATQTVPV